MLKKYEKPKILMMNLVGNEQLCGSCADQGATCISKDPGMYDIFKNLIIGDPNGDGELSREEYYEAKLFGGKDEGCEKQVINYCKFTSSGTPVAWS